MSKELMSTRDVEVVTGLSGTAITKLIQARKFPRPLLVGTSYVHRRDIVQDWLRSRQRVRRGGRLEYRHREVVMA